MKVNIYGFIWTYLQVFVKKFIYISVKFENVLNES